MSNIANEYQTALDELRAVRNGSQYDKAEALTSAMTRLGVKSALDIVNPNFTKSSEVFSRGQHLECIKLLSAAHAAKYGKDQNVKFGYTSDSLLNGTFLITGLMEEVTPKLQNQTLRALFPEAEHAAQTLALDTFGAIKGMTHQTGMDEPVPVIKKRGITTAKFSPASAQENYEISQEEGLFLRNPGDSNLSVRGLATYMAYWNTQLTHRGLVRNMDDIYTAIFDGELVYKTKTLSYGIPAGNRIFTDNGTLSGFWGTITDDNIVPNPTANPILDLSIILNNILKRYRGLKMKLMMNPLTHQLFAQNATVISRTSFIYANNAIINPVNTGGVTMETGLKYFLGGDLNVEVIIDNSVYIPDENDPHGYTDGIDKYVLPDYKIWVYIDTDGFGRPLGEYSYTLAAQNGGLMAPKTGKYFYMVDTSASQTIDGISQPRIFVGHGWNGWPRIMRPKDIWTIDVSNQV